MLFYALCDSVIIGIKCMYNWSATIFSSSV